MAPKIIIHGGFFSESLTNNEVKSNKQKALKKIAEQSHAYLLSHSAVETVVYAVALLEDCELFNAGLGSQIQSDGKIRMSAALMDGHTQRFSGVINIEDVQNPIQVASHLMGYNDRVLGGPEALSFARKQGFRFYDPETAERRLDYEFKLKQAERTGTVGCVALDAQGHLAAATSTGGKGFEVPGRISDSATVAGNYANADAGISCTGVGEDIVSAALAAKIVTRVTDGFSLREATDKTMAELRSYDGFAGIIGISSQGEIYHSDTHPYMVWAAYSTRVETFL